MNRRNFLKIGSLVLGGTALFSGWNFFRRRTELEDLYAYLESHTVRNPFEGNVSFKLYPYQKEILKNIHENDKVVIVKARQIGMTTLLAGYLSWRNDPYRYYTINEGMAKDFKEIFDRFVKQSDKGKFDKPCHVLDEANLDRIPLPHLTNKTIIVGTPDGFGNLKFVVDRKNLFGLKVFTYSANDCFPMYNEKKLEIVRWGYNNETENFQRDVEAKFV